MQLSIFGLGDCYPIVRIHELSRLIDCERLMHDMRANAQATGLPLDRLGDEEGLEKGMHGHKHQAITLRVSFFPPSSRRLSAVPLFLFSPHPLTHNPSR